MIHLVKRVSILFRRDLTVRFNECDGLGHVNNGVYFTYMEEARIDIFRIFNPDFSIPDWNLIVASTRCDFLRQVRFAETICVYTWISQIGNTSFTVEHGLQNGQGDWVARGQAVLLGYDFHAARPVSLSSTVRSVLTQHQSGPDGVPTLRA